jgi:hypothetical protein
MKLPLLGWRSLAFIAVVFAALLLATACQQNKQQPPQAQGEKAAAEPTAQLPQNMLDALHGKRADGSPAPAEGTPPGMPPQGMMAKGAPAGMAGGMPGGMKPHVPAAVIVPEAVKKGWKAVVLQVIEKGGATKDYKIPINGEMAIPGSSLTVKVESFLPDFKMTQQGITSLSNQPKNPAAKVRVVEGGKPVFNGWLFKMFPEAHPFEHPKYRMILKDYVAA